MSSLRVLVIDDEPGLRHTLQLILGDEGFEVLTANDGEEGLRVTLAEKPEIVLCDIRMPRLDGLGFVERHREAGGTALVIMMSAYGTLETAVEAMRRGAYDYISKPFNADEIILAVRKAEEREALQREVKRLRARVRGADGFQDVIGGSSAFREVLDLAARVAPFPTTVLVTGESGTGKELVARALHYNGERKDRPFVALFCGSLPDELLESELFGHKKGSFTGATADKPGLFEAADGGTVFLDEVGDLSPKLQTALLRVLQTGEVKRVGETRTRTVDVRVVAATNKPLREEIREGRFREDLFYRLNTIELELPPLRRRPADVVLLAHLFLDRFATGRRAHVRSFSEAALAALKRYPWPGNVRELENAVERAVVLARADEITEEDLRLPGFAQEQRSAAAAEGYAPDLPVKEVERRHVLAALTYHDGNVSETARVLGVSRRWLHYRLNDWQGNAAEA
jgi:Nif-specific regulatory protein